MIGFRIALVAAAVGLSVPASAATIIGGTTAVRVTADLGTLGLTLGTTGTASLSTSIFGVARALFGITGGVLDPGTLAGNILHDGSGVSFTAGDTTLTAANFIIDTVNSSILGDVAVNGTSLASDAPLFSFDLSNLPAPAALVDLADPKLPLIITATAAGVFTQVFGTRDLTGAQFGLAATSPELAMSTAIPEPATWGMMIIGIGLVGGMLRRRRIGPATVTS